MIHSLPAEALGLAFPFHFALDRDMVLAQVGPRLSDLDPRIVRGESVLEWFALERPRIAFDFESLANHTELVFLISSKVREGLTLRGQMIRDLDRNLLFFLGSPNVSDVEELTSLGLSLRDLAPHDALGDLLIMLQAKEVALSDAQKIAEKLTESETRFRELIRSSSDIVAVLTPDAVLKYVSPAVEVIMGIAPDELMGTSLIDLIDEEDGLSLSWTLSQVVEEPLRVRNQQFRWESRAGQTVVLDAVFRNALANPYIAGVVVNARDITQKEELRQQLVQAQKLDVLGQLAGGIAHDFNNLIYVISSYGEFLQEDTPSGHPHHDDLSEILRAAEQAAGLTEQILSFSRKRVVVASVFDFSTVGRDQEEILKRLVPPEIDLVFRYGKDLDPVKADLAQISQVIVNLVINARDAISGSGTITVDFENRDLPVDRADRLGSVLSAGHYVVCSVTDTGSGMTEDVLRHAFDPFFTTKNQGEGTGLGLSTVYGVVNQHGGGVFADSEVDRGTRIAIWFPRSDDLPSRPMTEVDREILRGGTERILVVDDAAPVLAIVERSLGGLGYRVTTEQYPESALRRFPAENFDLVVSDIAMPGMTGPEFAEQIQVKAPGTPILFVSGYAEDKWFEPIAGENFPILSKPFSKLTLARYVRRVLDGKDPRMLIETDVGVGIEPEST